MQGYLNLLAMYSIKMGLLWWQTIELWKRDPVACIKELMQDPQFAKHMCYAPEKMYTNEGMKHQTFDEMATGKWWWAMQACIPCLYDLLQDFNNGCIQKLLPKGCDHRKQSYFCPIKHSSPPLAGTSLPGQFTLLLVTLMHLFEGSHQNKPWFWLVTYLCPS